MLEWGEYDKKNSTTDMDKFLKDNKDSLKNKSITNYKTTTQKILSKSAVQWAQYLPAGRLHSNIEWNDFWKSKQIW